MYIICIGKGCSGLTRFNKIAIQAKGPDGKRTRKQLAYRESNNVQLRVTRPPQICANILFPYSYVDKFFHSFIDLSENAVLTDAKSTLIIY